jgi:hypothetical protein
MSSKKKKKTKFSQVPEVVNLVYQLKTRKRRRRRKKEVGALQLLIIKSTIWCWKLEIGNYNLDL